MRNCCKECPWTTKSKHNDSWPDYVKTMETKGNLSNGIHACHMITSDTWGFNNPIKDANVCIGSINARKRNVESI